MAILSCITYCTAIVLPSLLQAPSGQVEDRTAAKPEPTASETAPVDFAALDRETPPTAEQLLRELKQKRPSSDPILPASAREGNAWPRSRTLLPEGAVVVKRSGSLAWEDPWWILRFDPGESRSTTKLLPNTNLEIMVRTSASSTTPIRFIVSGETTVCQDENYLLVQVATRAANRPDQAPGENESAVSKESSDRRSGPASVDPNAANTAAQRTLADASAEDVLSIMKEQRPAQQSIPSEPNLLTLPLAYRATNAGPLVPEGAAIVNRPGRLVRQGDWWTFAFESDHADHPEPPLKLLPNQSLELMVEAATHSSTGLVFFVSGEVTAFEGENYILPRMAMRRIDAGNLSR